MHVGKRIKALVETEGLAITEVAKTIDKTRQTVYDLFTKQHVSTDILEKLSIRYAVPMAYFFDEYFPLPPNLTPASSGSNPSGAVNLNRHASVSAKKENEAQDKSREADLHKIIHLQEKLLAYEQARQSFLLFLDRIHRSIIDQKGYQKSIPPNEEQAQGAEAGFSEISQVSAADNQKAYQQVFELYADFEVFFKTGFITDVYWKRAWQKHQANKQNPES